MASASPATAHNLAYALPPGRSNSTVLLVSGILIGTLVFGGLLAFHVAMTIAPPASPYQTLDPPTVAYRSTVRSLSLIFGILMDLAVAGSIVVSWYVATSPSDRPESVRRGLLIFSAAFLIAWLFLSMTFFLSLRYF